MVRWPRVSRLDDMSRLQHDLLGTAIVAVIPGAGWPQFEDQVVSHLPRGPLLRIADSLSKLIGPFLPRFVVARFGCDWPIDQINW